MEDQNQTPPTLCRANCGFFGSSSTGGYCSKCFKEHIDKQQNTADKLPLADYSKGVTSAIGKIELEVGEKSAEDSFELGSTQLSTISLTDNLLCLPSTSSEAKLSPIASIKPNTKEDKPKKKNRCQMCRKNVGLTGFNCRCGGLFCCEHRYDKAHNCTYDYKAEARAEIQRNNPVIGPKKMDKI